MSASDTSTRPSAVVTVAALYGTGGRVIGPRVAERLVDSNDRARMDYVRGAYGMDGEDPSLYHLMIDALALGFDGCVDLIVAASQTRMAHA